MNNRFTGRSDKKLAAPSRVLHAANYAAQLVAILLDVVDLIDDDGIGVVPDEATVDAQLAVVPQLAPHEIARLGPRVQGHNGSGRRQPLHSISATEPAIAALARHWALLLDAVDFSDECGSLQLDGFRLLRAGDWVIPSSGHPAEVYEYLARVCNVSCTFCYLYGNPSTMAIARGKKVVSNDEIATRLKYFDPRKRRALFRAQWEINEFLVDPKLPEVLRELRQRTSEPFFFVTNGSPLVPRVIDLLAEVQPVELIVSINSIDHDLRSAMMHESERQTLTAMACFERLADRKIPFGVSLAAFPEFPIPLLERTIRSVESCVPTFVRINLPGYTAEMPYAAGEDLDKHWFRVVEWVRSIRSTVSIPVITIPSAYEEGSFHIHANEPRVLGIVPNSPGGTIGLAPGDIVRRIGAFKVHTRAEAIALLLMVRKPTAILVERDGVVLKCALDPNSASDYPYRSHQTGKYMFPYGVVMAPSLSREHARQIRKHIDESSARKTWILTSVLMQKAAQQLITTELPDCADAIELVRARNDYLGGNIRIMDMCTIGDLARAVEERLKDSVEPELILVPGSGFNFQGRDLTGRHWGDLERWFGIPVRTLEVAQFLF
jgi:wyosine [tRNA(Phe)-imidazoG37] synthetase (radical SAM superfamily)